MGKSSFLIILLQLFISAAGYSQYSKLLAVISFPKVDKEPLSAIPSGAIVLYDGWQMKESAIVGMNGEKISSPEYKAENWYLTSVPTTVLGTLIRSGVYPDPYIGMNNMLIPDMNDDHNKRYDLAKYSHMPDKSNPWTKPYWFRKEFELPENFSGKIIWLNVDGINYRADVWVNGKLVDNSKNLVGMFRRFRLNITRYARPGQKNAVAIAIHPLDFPGDPLYEQTEGLKGNLGPNGGDAEILRNVTQYSAIGWDWVPAVRDRNMGIWQHISLNASGPVVLIDPAAFTQLKFKKDTTAEITVRYFITNASETDQKVDMEIIINHENSPEKISAINTILNLKAGSSQEVILKPDDYRQLILNNPDLWWPVSYGKHPLYNLFVTAKVNGNLSSTVKSNFGIRELGSFMLPGGGRAFSVNGKTIRITGGAWINDFLLSWSAQRYRDEVRLMAEGNATAVRINGCSIMPPDVFFDECDRRGLLVWQDMSRTSVSPDFRKDKLHSRRPPSCDSTIYINNMVDCISRMRGHSSLFLWCGSNEDAPQENTGKVLQNIVLPQMDGTRVFIASSSEQPVWSNVTIGTYTGGPWQMVPLAKYYRMYAEQKGFESRNEIGLASLPSVNSVASAIPDFNDFDEASFPLNKTMGFHDATGDMIMGSYLKLMKEDIGYPSSLAEFLIWGDLYNNQVYRTIFEAANKARPRNEGTMLWKTNAAWLSFNWQIFDWFLKPNAGYFTMKSACKPLHIQFSQDDSGIEVISTLQKEMKVAVNVTSLSSDGKKTITKKFLSLIDADKTVFIDSIKELRNDSSLNFIALDLIDQSGNKIDRTVTWSQIKTNWRELLTVPPVDIDCKLLGKEEYGDEMGFSFEIKNCSAWPAVNVIMSLTDGAFGKEILPAFWDNNALTMMPGESEIIKLRVRKNLITKTPFLMTEGLNVNTACRDIFTGKKLTIHYKIDDFTISTRDGKAYLNFSATQTENSGNRISTFPVKVSVDGKIYRFVTVAVKPGMKIDGRVLIANILSGKHKVQFGTLIKEIAYKTN
jgi:hypothetical protein